MKPLLAALAVLVLGLAAPALAQSTQPEQVVLQGWALPEGTSVVSTSHVLRRAQVRQFDSAEAASRGAEPVRVLDVFTARADSVQTSFALVDEAGPVRVERHMFISDILEDVHEGDEILERDRHPNPLSGTHYVAERTDEGPWQRRFLSPARPSEEQVAELAGVRFDFAGPQYPARPVAVGDEWAVDRQVLAELFGALAPERTQRMTFRLDSLGTFVGQPAAFLSYGLDVTMQAEGGVLMTQNEVGIVVRLVERFVDVYEERQGTFRTEREGRLEDGRPYFSVMEGEIRGRTHHLYTIPAHGAASAP